MSNDAPPERESVSVSRVIHAPAERIFDLLTDIQRHQELDGSTMLQGRAQGPARLELGSTFTMGMRQFGLPYRTPNTVVEFEPNRLITWRTMARLGPVLIGGQGWRWQLIPQGDESQASADDGPTLVIHTYLWEWSRVAPLLRLGRYPDKMAPGLRESLAHLAAAVESD